MKDSAKKLNGRWATPNRRMAKRDINTINKRKHACNDNNSARLNCNESTLVLWPIIFTIYMVIQVTGHRDRVRE